MGRRGEHLKTALLSLTPALTGSEQSRVQSQRRLGDGLRVSPGGVCRARRGWMCQFGGPEEKSGPQGKAKSWLLVDRIGEVTRV